MPHGRRNRLREWCRKAAIIFAALSVFTVFAGQSPAVGYGAEGGSRPNPWHFKVIAAGSQKTAASRIAAEADRLMRNAADYLGHEPSGPFLIYVAGDIDEYRKLAGPGAPEWATAVYINGSRRIVMRAPSAAGSVPERFVNTLQHELVHAALDHYFRGRPSALPLWLNEGLAVKISGEWESPESWESRKIKLYTALRDGQALDFNSISGSFPASEFLAQLAYAQSYDLTDFIIREYGEKRMRRFLAELAAGRPENTAARLAFRTEMEDIDAEWRQSLTAPGPTAILMHFFVQFDNYIWAALALLTVAAGARVFLRLRRLRSDYSDEDSGEGASPRVPRGRPFRHPRPELAAPMDDEWDDDLYGERPWRPPQG